MHCNAHIVYLYNDIKCIKASFLPHCNRFVTSVGLTEYLISAFFNFYRMILVKLDNCKTILYWKSHLILKTEKRVICNYHLGLHKLFHKTEFRYAPMELQLYCIQYCIYKYVFNILTVKSKKLFT